MIKAILKKPYFLILLGVLSLFIGLYFLSGSFYFEEFTDIMFTGFMQGVMAEPTGFFNNYMYHTILSHIYAFLYGNTSGVSWFGVFFTLYMYIGVCHFVIIIYLLSRQFSSRYNLLFFFALAFAFLAFMSEHIILIQFTKVTWFLAAPSMLYLLLAYFNKLENPITKKAFLWHNTWIIIAVLTRLETITMLFFITFFIALLLPKFNVKYKLGFIKVLWPSLIVTLAIWVAFNIDFTPTDKEYRKIRAYSNTLWDFGQAEESLKLTSRKDSTIYFTARSFYFNDIEHINKEFFESIKVEGLDKAPYDFLKFFDDWDYRVKKVGEFTFLLKSKQLFYLLFIIIFTLMFAVLFWGQPFNYLLRYIVFQAVFWLMLYGISVLMKTEDRITLPLILMNYVWSLVLISYLAPPYASKLKKVLLVVMTILIMPVALYRFYDWWPEVKQRQKSEQLVKVAKAEIDELYNGKTIVFNLWAWNLIYENVFSTGKLPEGNTYLSLDNGLLYLYPAYSNYLENTLGVSKTDEVIKELLKRKDEVIYVSAEDRMQLMQTYMADVYNIDVNYIKIDGDFDISEPVQLLNWDDKTFVFNYYRLQ